jgi:hypothetical protein
LLHRLDTFLCHHSSFKHFLHGILDAIFFNQEDFAEATTSNCMVEYEIVLVHLLAGDIAFDVFTAAKRLCFGIAHI